MPWTAEQKRADRAAKKADRAAKKAKARALVKHIYPVSPIKFLKVDDPKNWGVVPHDYGGKQKSLNFPLSAAKGGMIGGVKVGSVSVGNRYLRDAKITLNKERDVRDRLGNIRTMSLQSEKNKEYLQRAERSFHHLLPAESAGLMEFLQLNFIRGAKTLWHTDAFHGVLPNLLLIESAQEGPFVFCGLYINLFPRFRSSVVSLHGRFYIPMRYSEANGSLTLIGYGRNAQQAEDDVVGKEQKDATFIVVNESLVYELQPVGDLPYAVIGIKFKKLQVLPLNDKPQVIKHVSELNLELLCDAIDLAHQHPAIVPRQRYKTLIKRDEWMVFEAWRYMHCWIGDNLASRHHANFQLIWQSTSSANTKEPLHCRNYVNLRK